MCVKCQPDGELPGDEKYLTWSVLAVQILHPAAAHDRYKLQNLM